MSAASQNIITPKLAFPFRLTSSGTSAVYREQDGVDEIVDCVEVLLSTVRGERIEVPDYGISEQTMKVRPSTIDLSEVKEAIAFWEERADVRFEDISNMDADSLLLRLRLEITRREND